MASLAPGRPPSKAASGRAACCCWMESWLPRRLFPPAVQARPAGEEAPGLRSVSRTPCHNKGTMAWMGWRWEGGRAARLCSHSHQGRGQVAGRSAPSSPPRPVLFSTLSGTVSHRGAKENRPQETLLGCCWGPAALGGSRAGGGDWHHTGSTLPGAVANGSQVCFTHKHPEDFVSLHLGVFRPSTGPATEQAAEIICWINKWKIKHMDTFIF